MGKKNARKKDLEMYGRMYDTLCIAVEDALEICKNKKVAEILKNGMLDAEDVFLEFIDDYEL